MSREGILKGYLNGHVMVVTTDGRQFSGTLNGYDQTANLILSAAQERLGGSMTDRRDAGLMVIRGDMVALVGSLDLEIEGKVQALDPKPTVIPAFRNYTNPSMK